MLEGRGKEQAGFAAALLEREDHELVALFPGLERLWSAVVVQRTLYSVSASHRSWDMSAKLRKVSRSTEFRCGIPLTGGGCPYPENGGCCVC